MGVISTDLSVGPNRLAFFLLDSHSEPLSSSVSSVSTYYPTGASGGKPGEVAIARFRRWPLGGLGVYTTNLSFPEAGTWTLTVVVTEPDGPNQFAQLDVEIKEVGLTPAIGSPAPPSRNKTSRDVGSLEELTTARPPDPDLYTMTIADALSTGVPLVVVFATPAFCETATCGPQVGVIAEIKDRYKDRANFIHVEIFENPHEIQGEPDKANASPAVEEWGLQTEPWTFIVDERGLIAAKFEAFTTAEEIEEALDKLLPPGGP